MPDTPGEDRRDHFHDGKAHGSEPAVATGQFPRSALQSVAGVTDVVDGVPPVIATDFGACAATVGPAASIDSSDSQHSRKKRLRLPWVRCEFFGRGARAEC